MRNVHQLWKTLGGSAGTALALTVLAAGPTDAQTAARGASNWVVEPTLSSAWWQMNPHFGHLWATTCPADPNWSAGEGNSGGYAPQLEKGEKKMKVPQTAVMDYRIPLHPRKDIVPVCRKAVVGQIQVADIEGLRGAKGFVSVAADSLEIGSNMRNAFAKKLMTTGRYPRIEFKLDSVVNVRQAGDTIKGNALGTVTIHGVDKPVAVLFDAVPHTNGQVRVTGRWQMSPRQLTQDFGMSKWVLGAGIGMDLWKELHMGFDIIVKPGPPVQSMN
jgi:hypothetical protein